MAWLRDRFPPVDFDEAALANPNDAFRRVGQYTVADIVESEMKRNAQ